MEPILLRIPEAAALVALGKSKFYELVLAGDIPVLRVGRAVRVPVEDLRAWAAAQGCRPHLVVEVLSKGNPSPRRGENDEALSRQATPV